MHRFIILLTAVVIAFGIGGCGGGTISSDPLGTDSITVGNVLPVVLGGSVSLTATVTNASGKAVVGREVTFATVSNQSGAAIVSSKINTNSDGVAAITYHAGTTNGVDVVRASISNGNYGDISITVGSGSLVGLQIVINGSPTTVAAGKSSILTATVKDASGNLLSGQAVTFGFVTPSTIVSNINVLNGTTDGSGQAVAVYTAGTGGTGNVDEIVKATVGIIGAGGSLGTVTITRTVSSTAKSLSLVASATSLAAGQSAVITATVTNTETGTAAVGQVVTFTLIPATPAIGSTITPINDTTDGSGRAVLLYTAGSTGTASVQETVKATVGTMGVDGSAGVVIITRTASSVTPPVGFSMTLAASATSLAAGQSAVITATVTNTQTGTVAVGQLVTFTLIPATPAIGSTITPINDTTDGSGRAVLLYTAGSTGTASVQETVKATVGTMGSGGSAGAVIFTRTASGAAAPAGFSMTLAATATSLAAGQSTVITATVTNTQTGTVAVGQLVTFTLIPATPAIGSTIAPINDTTDGSGRAVLLYTAGSTGTASVQETVKATVGTMGSGGSAGAVIITRQTAGTGNRLSLTLTPATTATSRLATTSSDCIVKATVVDEHGNDVASVPVTFSIVVGTGSMTDPTGTTTITAPTVLTIVVLTDNNGEAWVTFTGPGGVGPGETVVRATITGTTNGGDTAGIIYW